MVTETDYKPLLNEIDKKMEGFRKDVKEEQADAIRKALEEFGNNLDKQRAVTTNAGANTTTSDMPWAISKDAKLRMQTENIHKLAQDSDLLEAMGKFCQAIYLREKRNGYGLSEAVIKALGESSGATGGFMVPYEFKPELLRLIIESQVVRPRATIIPMNTDMAVIPRINDTSHVSTIHGGMKGTWTYEGATIDQNDPAFAQVILIPKKYDNMNVVANELIMDSPIAIPPILNKLNQEAIGFFEDCDALTGVGAGKMLGAFIGSQAISVTRDVASQISYNDCVTMMTHLFPSSWDNAVWVCSTSAWGQLMQLGVPIGTGGSAVMVANIAGQSAAQRPPTYLLGLPLIVSEKVSALGTAKDLLLADFSYYLIGDRMQLSMTTSTDRYFEKDQTAFRVIERLDGQPWINMYLTAHNGTDTLSAFVYLN